MQLNATAVNLHPLLKHALRTCEPDFRQKNISVMVDLAATKELIWGDRARLLQVFWNLLKNAAKFTPEDQKVEVSTRDEANGMVRVQVRDTGIGIENERLQSIFNAFEQGASTATRKYGGLGLGLSIGKALVELHGGKITAFSRGKGHGSLFTVDFPAAPQITQTNEPTPDPEALPRDRNRKPPGGNPRILLVEDHVDTSFAMQRLLRHAGYQVTAAESVASAIQACDVASEPFAAVISDIGLPDGSGLDLMRQLRARYPGIPGVALSGFGMEDDLRRSREAGFTSHLTKPVNIDLLHATLKAAVQAKAEATC
jgi:CheY-like chemotaxis protein